MSPAARVGRVVLGIAVVAVVLTGLSVDAQEATMEWQERVSLASELTRGITVFGAPYVNGGSEYDPQQRPIHAAEFASRIDYPVQLSDSEWRERLTDFQYHVLRSDGTEPACSNFLFDNKESGIYYSVATGQPLFHSDDKFTSGTGWPSFTRPISPDAVAYFWDLSYSMQRIEVVDSLSGSHLGHVFSDGPGPGGQRYCINGEALVFVPEGGTPPPLLID
jgi:methionine-R-sulfoxide reductase